MERGRSIVEAVEKAVLDLGFNFWTQVTANKDQFGEKSGNERIILYAGWTKEFKSKKLLTKKEYLKFVRKLHKKESEQSDAYWR